MVVWLWYSPAGRMNFGLGLAWLIYFGVVTVIDIEHRVILHPVSLVGAGFGFVTGIYMHGLWPTVLGGLAGFLSMLALYFLGIGYLRLVARMRKMAPADGEALGFGDVNLSGVLGLVLGWPGIALALFLTILIAAAASIIYLAIMLLLKRYQPYLSIPYGPFLIAGAVILLYF
jgi:leader peptidase (prepilin peptidase)/N-methyltransferase